MRHTGDGVLAVLDRHYVPTAAASSDEEAGEKGERKSARPGPPPPPPPPRRRRRSPATTLPQALAVLSKNVVHQRNIAEKLLGERAPLLAARELAVVLAASEAPERRQAVLDQLDKHAAAYASATQADIAYETIPAAQSVLDGGGGVQEVRQHAFFFFFFFSALTGSWGSF